MFFLSDNPLLSASENLPFVAAIIIIMIIAVLEGVGMLLGLSFCGLLEKALPDWDLEVDAPHFEHHGPLVKFFSWLRIGRIPLLVIVILFSLFFGLSGLIIQGFSFRFFNSFLPLWLGVPLCFFLVLPFLRLSIGFIARILPKDESDAIPLDSLIGRVGTIVIGSAYKSHPAQAKIRDKKGKNHYVMVEPNREKVILEQSEQILIVKQLKPFLFSAIKNPHKNILS